MLFCLLEFLLITSFTNRVKVRSIFASLRKTSRFVQAHLDFFRLTFIWLKNVGVGRSISTSSNNSLLVPPAFRSSSGFEERDLNIPNYKS